MKIHIEAAARLRSFIKAGRETGEGAGAIFYAESTGRFLLVLRSDEGDEPNTWCGLGGGRDRLPNGEFETLDETVRREAYEEAGFPMDAPCDLYLIDTDQQPDGFKFTNYLALVPKEFKPVLNEEHKDFRWSKWDQFPANMHPKMLEVLKSKLGRMTLRKHCDVPF